MPSRRFSQSVEERDRLNALLALMGYVYEDGERQRLDVSGFLAELLEATSYPTESGEEVWFRVKTRLPVSHEDYARFKSAASLLKKQ
jgi:hypothetical protein